MCFLCWGVFQNQNRKYLINPEEIMDYSSQHAGWCMHTNKGTLRPIILYTNITLGRQVREVDWWEKNKTKMHNMRWKEEIILDVLLGISLQVSSWRHRSWGVAAWWWWLFCLGRKDCIRILQLFLMSITGRRWVFFLLFSVEELWASPRSFPYCVSTGKFIFSHVTLQPHGWSHGI